MQRQRGKYRNWRTFEREYSQEPKDQPALQQDLHHAGPDFLLHFHRFSALLNHLSGYSVCVLKGELTLGGAIHGLQHSCPLNFTFSAEQTDWSADCRFRRPAFSMKRSGRDHGVSLRERSATRPHTDLRQGGGAIIGGESMDCHFPLWHPCPCTGSLSALPFPAGKKVALVGQQRQRQIHDHQSFCSSYF